MASGVSIKVVLQDPGIICQLPCILLVGKRPEVFPYLIFSVLTSHRSALALDSPCKAAGLFPKCRTQTTFL